MRSQFFIKKDDYEHYKIPFSFICLFPAKKKMYIYEELEKKHPCFSEDFSYFLKKHISRKGIFYNAVVIHKSKLSEYQSKTGSNKFNLEECKNQIIKLNSERYRIFYLISLILCLIIIFIVFFVQMNGKKITKSESIISNSKKDFIGKNNLYNQNDLRQVLNLIRENNGRLLKLDWKLNINSEQLSFYVKNIYPEVFQNKIKNIEIPIINYENKVPIFECSLINNNNLSNNCVNNNNFPLNIKNEIRTLLEKNNIRVIEETAEPYSLLIETDSFSEKIKNLFVLQIFNLLNENNIYIKELSINKITSNLNFYNMQIRLLFSSDSTLKNDSLKVIGENLDLFFDQSLLKNNKNKLDNNKQNYLSVRNLSEDLQIEEFRNKYEIIGEMSFNKNKKILFYIDEKGLIKRKEFNYEK